MTVHHVLRRGLAYIKGEGSFAACLLAAVLSTAILAFVFGADGHLVLMLLVLGLITAAAEARIRGGDRR